MKLLTLHVTWIRRLIIKNSEWSNIYTETTQRKITNLFQYGAGYPRQKAHSTSNTFWKETLLYFPECFNIAQHKNTQTLLKPLWYDKYVWKGVSLNLLPIT